ncbi:hypothetical protein QBC39DRAFT_333703 [Podospora conica]|nr:hypothetical protein QBC39DRAFT_333703 [Schizothecium conicum]
MSLSCVVVFDRDRLRGACKLVDRQRTQRVAREVDPSEFYKHIESEGLIDTRRMKQLLTWCRVRLELQQQGPWQPRSLRPKAERPGKTFLTSKHGEKSRELGLKVGTGWFEVERGDDGGWLVSERVWYQGRSRLVRTTVVQIVYWDPGRGLSKELPLAEESYWLRTSSEMMAVARCTVKHLPRTFSGSPSALQRLVRRRGATARSARLQGSERLRRPSHAARFGGWLSLMSLWQQHAR